MPAACAGPSDPAAMMATAPLPNPGRSRCPARSSTAKPQPAELARLLDHLLNQAGNPSLMTAGLKDTLVAQAAGHPRTLAVMADNLLVAAEQDREVLDEQLFIGTLGEQAQPGKTRQ